jgi:hypothetical protein
MQLDVLAASHIIGIGRGVDVQSSILTSLTGDKVCLSVVGEQALASHWNWVVGAIDIC